MVKIFLFFIFLYTNSVTHVIILPFSCCKTILYQSYFYYLHKSLNVVPSFVTTICPLTQTLTKIFLFYRCEKNWQKQTTNNKEF